MKPIPCWRTNAAGDLKFAAIIEQEPAEVATTLTLAGEDEACDVRVNLATLALVESSRTPEQVEAFEIPAIQLVETFRPLVEEEDAGKADGVLTKVGAGAGIGAALLTAITWEFAAGAAAASSTFSVPLWPAS